MAPALQDSRRLTGPNIHWRHPGAVVDVSLGETQATEAIAHWREAVSSLLKQVGWGDQQATVRRFPGGASLVISAPLDALYAATEINEQAWAWAEARLAGAPEPDLADQAVRLREVISSESQPAVLALKRAAEEHGVTFLVDDDFVSVGLGKGSRTWPTSRTPRPEEIEWSEVHDVPVVLITGCNGKTTSVRLMAAVARAAGIAAGSTSTDGIRVGRELVEAGDYAGPGGARTLLRQPGVELAILETARGGMLRRGLAVTRADAALVTNVAEDHLGEFGIGSLEQLARVKLLVTSVVRHGGVVVLNAEDLALVAGSGEVAAPITWFSLDPDNEVLRNHLAGGGTGLTVLEGTLVEIRSGRTTEIAAVESVPITLRGAARHNVSNVLGVIGLAQGLGIEPVPIARGLASFEPSGRDNPGRLNLFEFDGLKVLVDFAHNPHGMLALAQMAQEIDSRRTLLLTGQAGDRDDDAIRELARCAWVARPDRLILKEMPVYLRGRQSGETTGIMAAELERLGAPEQVVTVAPDELAGVTAALEWGRSGDLLLLTIHEARAAVLSTLARMENDGWKPGDPVPPITTENGA